MTYTFYTRVFEALRYYSAGGIAPGPQARVTRGVRADGGDL